MGNVVVSSDARNVGSRVILTIGLATRDLTKPTVVAVNEIGGPVQPSLRRV